MPDKLSRWECRASGKAFQTHHEPIDTAQPGHPCCKAAGGPRPRPHSPAQAYTTYKLGGQVSELLYSPATFGLDLSAKDMIKPRARAAPMLAVLRNTLWMFGGTVEVGGRAGAGC